MKDLPLSTREDSAPNHSALAAFKSWIGVHHVMPAIGGSLAIGAVLLVCNRWLGLDSAALLVASMGASAVLLFGLPEGPLSRPWSVVGGHLVSALVGVCVAATVPTPVGAAALSVGLAIMLMSVCKCTHPPGGATALSAVIGGPAVHALGVQYVFTPVLLNAALMVSIAWVFHRPSGRYRMRRSKASPSVRAEYV